MNLPKGVFPVYCFSFTFLLLFGQIDNVPEMSLQSLGACPTKSKDEKKSYRHRIGCASLRSYNPSNLHITESAGSGLLVQRYQFHTFTS